MQSLLDMIPFQFLNDDARAELMGCLDFREVAAGSIICPQGDTTDRSVFLLEKGSVHVIDHHRGPNTQVNVIHAGHYFGERPALFGSPRAVEIRAATPCRLAVLAEADFLALLRNEPQFAHAMTFILRDKQGMFAAFERFLAEIKLGASRRHLVIAKLLPYFKATHPSLHRQANTDVLDTAALSYAVNRLPTNVASTFVWFATDELPPRYSSADVLFRSTSARARRRSSWEMMPGKSMLLLRDGESDLLDLITLLCIYAIEARKLRRRFRGSSALTRLKDSPALHSVFTPDELETLEELWPGEVSERLLEISLHHEDITVHTYKRTHNYNSAHAEVWTTQVAAATSACMGRAPRSLPDDLPVHIISSNTHSVSNCLSPWLHNNAEALRSWGREVRPAWFAQHWPHPDDLLIALLRPYLIAHPEQREIRKIQDQKVRVRLDETAFTGIRVELFRMNQLHHCGLCGAPDDGLIINIDYAFGQQAEPLISNLINLFGHRIRSINILGKAGALVGERGDILVADGFIHQRNDALLTLKNAVNVERLRGRFPDRTVHTGRILTVLGTVLQNDELLEYYKKLWGCIGVEMEGSHYGSQILDSRALGMLRRDVQARFLYYTSDLPLRSDASLAKAMSPWEGIPPLYAITREILDSVLT